MRLLVADRQSSPARPQGPPVPARAPSIGSVPAVMGRGLLIVELCLVLALSLGRSGVYAVVDLIAAATAPGSMSTRTAVMNGSLAPGRAWLDLTLQLLSIGFGLVPVLLVAYLLIRSGTSPRALWFGHPTVRFVGVDLLRGLLVAAVVGGTGIGFYLLTHAMGVELTVVAQALPNVWWRIPVLILSALQNALLEELTVIGFVLVRLRQLAAPPPVAIGLSALLRGSYHLYQGLGGFVGNLVMGVGFGWLYSRWGRVTPLIVAHILLDVGAFVGYAVLAGHVVWLPS
jgi:membrane protease YdiL (CAAX protease family)